jgi:hypothetical protein
MDNLTKYKLAQAQYISRNSTGMPVNSVDKQGEMHRVIGQRRWVIKKNRVIGRSGHRVK